MPGLGLSQLSLGLGDAGFIEASITVSIGSGPVLPGATLTATVNNGEGGEVITYAWDVDGVAAGTGSTFTAPEIGGAVRNGSTIGMTATIDGKAQARRTRTLQFADLAAPLAQATTLSTENYPLTISADIPDSNQSRAQGAWWPQIVDVSEIAPQGTPPLMLIASSDHSDGDNANGGLFAWRGFRPQGPWTYAGQIFANSETYPQMEAPTAQVLIDPQDGQRKLFVWAHYVPDGYSNSGPTPRRQVSITLVSSDAAQALQVIPGSALDAALPAYALTNEPYNAHFGYLSVAPNMFDGLLNPQASQPWTYIGTSFYGDRQNSTAQWTYGRALWGLDSPRDAPTLIERYVFDRRFIDGAATRTIDEGNIAKQFEDLDGTLWGLQVTGGAGGFEIRAARSDQWGLVTSGAEVLFAATSIDTDSFPSPFTSDAEIISPQMVSAFKEQNGRIWAVVNFWLRETGQDDTNVNYAIPLNGDRAPVFNTDRDELLRYSDQGAIEYSASNTDFATSGAVTLDGTDIIITPDDDTFDMVTWTTPLNLDQYTHINFKALQFSDNDASADPVNDGDIWVFAAPANSADLLAASGIFAGGNADSPNGRVRFDDQGPNAGGHSPSDSALMRIGRRTGDVSWRYDLGVAVWPDAGVAGVTHSGDSLVETLSLVGDTDQKWTFGVAVRRNSAANPHATRIRKIEVSGSPALSATLPTAPTVTSAPVITGQPTEGETLSGTAGVFAGDNITDQGSEWQSSPNGTDTWTDTDDTDLTSPAQTLGLYYRLRSFATNAAGTTEAFSNVIGPAVAAPVSGWSFTDGQDGKLAINSSPDLPTLTLTDGEDGTIGIAEAA